MFPLVAFWIMHGYYGEKLQINHFWELRGEQKFASI